MFADLRPLRNRCKDKADFQINKKNPALFSKIYELKDETRHFLVCNPRFPPANPL